MTVGVLSLAEFLLARIAEDEQAVRGMFEAKFEPDWNLSNAIEDRLEVEQHFGARVTPARVLAECEAKRRIVEIHGEVRDVEFNPSCGGCGQYISGEVTPPACDTLTTLAAVYVDHPDYRAEWKP